MAELKHNMDDLRVLAEACPIESFRTLLLSWLDKALKEPDKAEEMQRQVKINLKLLKIL